MNLISLNLWKNILTFIEQAKKNIKTNGAMICGSLPNNKYQKGSDVDILLLSENIAFKMETIKKNNIYDKMTCSPNIINEILIQDSPLSDVLSLSFGLHNLIIEDSNLIRRIISRSELNIKNKNLIYSRPANKKQHIGNESFKLTQNNGIFKLTKNNSVLL